METTKNGPRKIHGLWKVAQGVSVVSAVGVVGLLLLRPDLGIFITWFVLIPLVPALLLVAPRVWRNLCPIAVVHQLPRVLGKGGTRRLSGRTHVWAPAVAVIGLFLIVPMRLPVFNQAGPALAAFVLVVLAAALVTGLVFAGKSGWCSTFCPVGPVERLYGQQPIVTPEHAHCATCIGCTDPCFDREGPPAVSRMAGEEFGVDSREGDNRAWLWQTPTGAFAAAFPGFIVGYFTADPSGGLVGIYAHILVIAALFFASLLAFQALLNFPARTGMRLGAALAAGLYYWFTVPAVLGAVEALQGIDSVPGWLEPVGQAAFLGLVLFWFLDAPRRTRRMAVEIRQAPGSVAS